MRRRNRVNGVLLGVGAALAVAAWLLPTGEGPARQRVTDRAPSEVRALSVEYPRETERPLSLERRAEGWHLTRPLARPARDGRVVTALRVLAARTRSCYPLGERDPAAFGLAPPRLVLHADGTTLAFGDRSADGRRYVRVDRRLCLTEDRAFPLLAGGVDALAAPALVPANATLLRIETPRAAADRGGPAEEWSLERGDANASAEAIRQWVARWQAAQAQSFVLEPPSADHGRLRVETDGGSFEWRIAHPPPEVTLVPAGADYGVALAAERGQALLQPPGASAPEPATVGPRP